MAIHSFDFGKLWSTEFLMPNGHPDSQDWARLKYSVERSALGIYDGAQNLGDLAIRKIFYGLDLTAPYWDRARVTDLTDAGDSALHYHATDRDLANATGTLSIGHGGTGQTTAQDAINALTQVSGATAEHVLTKDTGTGNAIFKATAPTHNPVTLDVNADSILSLSTQEIGLDTQIANYGFFGPTTGAAAVPTFRAMVAADLPAHTQNANTILIPGGVGTPTYDDLQDFLNVSVSAGRITGGALTPVDATHISVSAGEGMLRTTNSPQGTLIFVKWAANTNLLITADVTNYIYVDYNAGSPIIAATTNRLTINKNSQFVLGAAFTDGAETAHVVTTGMNLSNWATDEHSRLVECRRVEHAYGAAISETGTRNIASSDGVIYVAGVRQPITGIDTAGAGRFTAIYRDGSGGWTEVPDQTQINNTQYDDGDGTLATLTANRYGVFWVYVLYDGELYVKYGQGDYTLAQANDAVPSATQPEELYNFGIIAAKIIIKKSAAAFTSLSSAYQAPFVTQVVANHNDLSGRTEAACHPESAISSTITAGHVIKSDGSKLADDGGILGQDCSTTGSPQFSEVNFNSITGSCTLSGGVPSGVQGLLVAGDSGSYATCLSIKGTTTTRHIFIISEDGTTDNSMLMFYGDPSIDQFLFTLGPNGGRQMVLSDVANRTKDHDHAVQTNPTLYIHSITNPDSDNTQWLSFCHDTVKSVISSGKGHVLINGSFATVTTATSANLTLTEAHSAIEATGGAGGITITLPTNAAGAIAGRIYTITKVDAGAGAVTIDGDTAETINGALTQALAAQWDSITIKAMAAGNWMII